MNQRNNQKKKLKNIKNIKIRTETAKNEVVVLDQSKVIKLQIAKIILIYVRLMNLFLYILHAEIFIGICLIGKTNVQRILLNI